MHRFEWLSQAVAILDRQPGTRTYIDLDRPTTPSSAWPAVRGYDVAGC
ncbi:MAG TPA: hypothetical protein VGB58_08715 [Blastococcus sp.]